MWSRQRWVACVYGLSLVLVGFGATVCLLRTCLDGEAGPPPYVEFAAALFVFIAAAGAGLLGRTFRDWRGDPTTVVLLELYEALHHPDPPDGQGLTDLDGEPVE